MWLASLVSVLQVKALACQDLLLPPPGAQEPEGWLLGQQTPWAWTGTGPPEWLASLHA